jgi:hypothetical protein
MDCIPLSEHDIERQRQIEADAIQDGILRYAQSSGYQLATGSRPVRHLMGARGEQLGLNELRLDGVIIGKSAGAVTYRLDKRQIESMLRAHPGNV